MKKESGHRNYWKKIVVILLVLAGSFLLSIVGFWVLWSGIFWNYQLVMFFLFLLLSFSVSHWNKGAVGGCIFIACGVAPLGTLTTQFRDSSGSQLMHNSCCAYQAYRNHCWLFLAKTSLDSHSESSKDIASF